MFKGKITKNPKNLNINIINANRMYKEYAFCPFDPLYSNSKKHKTVLIASSTFKKRLNFLKFWKPKHLFKTDHWKCLDCGAEWDSESYPIDLNI